MFTSPCQALSLLSFLPRKFDLTNDVRLTALLG